MQFFKVAFFCRASSIKSQNTVVTHPSNPPIFRRHSLKLLSPTLPILMNWILLSSPPLSSDPDNPPKIGMCTSYSVIWEPECLKLQHIIISISGSSFNDFFYQIYYLVELI